MLNHKQNLFLILSACLASLQKFLKKKSDDIFVVFCAEMLLTSVCFFHIVKLYTAKID